MDFEYKMVVVTRNNLSLSPGKLAVQVAHASVACTLLTKDRNSKWFKNWQQEGSKKVVVKVDHEDDYLYLLLVLAKYSLQHLDYWIICKFFLLPCNKLKMDHQDLQLSKIKRKDCPKQVF